MSHLYKLFSKVRLYNNSSTPPPTKKKKSAEKHIWEVAQTWDLIRYET